MSWVYWYFTILGISSILSAVWMLKRIEERKEEFRKGVIKMLKVDKN